MPIFSDDNMSPEDRKRRNAEMRKRMGEAPGPKEKGVEELDLEDVVPGGSYLSMASPIGLGKSLLRGGIKKLGKEALEVGEKKIAKEGGKLIEKLAEKGVPKLEKRAVDYGAMNAERAASREAAEEAAPVLDYGSEAMKKTKEEIQREAKRKKIKPTSFEYANGRSPIETK